MNDQAMGTGDSVIMDGRADVDPTPTPPARQESSSANVRLVRIVSLLLAVQAMLLLGIVAWFMLDVNWEAELQRWTFTSDVADALAISFWLVLAGLILLPTALGLFFLRRGAWLVALSIQALLLLVTLTNYFVAVTPSLERSYRIFAVMASCVVLVFYLNLAGVRAVVEWRDDQLEKAMTEYGAD